MNAHYGRTFAKALYAPINERIPRTVKGAEHADSVEIRCELARRVPCNQIHPRIMVELVTIIALTADKRNSHLANTCYCVESISGMSAGCGLIYLPTSAKAVTNRKFPLGFLTKKDGLRYSATVSMSSGLRSTPSSSKSSHLLYWSSRHLGCGGWTDPVFTRASHKPAATLYPKLRVKHFFILLK